jgi:osmotically-inducible protein OsmY
MARNSAIGPADESKNIDPDLGLQVRNLLDGKNIPGLRRIGVEVSKGIVTLHGRVRTFYEKQQALHCCQGVAGVTQVVDAMTVDAIMAGDDTSD